MRYAGNFQVCRQEKMKEDCPPSSHVPISDSKSILKSELLSLLKTYNCYHEGKSSQLRRREGVPSEGAISFFYIQELDREVQSPGLSGALSDLPKCSSVISELVGLAASSSFLPLRCKAGPRTYIKED
ncbi:hypothetical protein E5288_WYG013316 [Bos mutus]|uniref:Uncharacterized protein n=1 Tax=Bos mutus TaxID=72004 RepID=A0A6B0S8I2_9CETA|nr:hypothetical protein [Bos mutus]